MKFRIFVIIAAVIAMAAIGTSVRLQLIPARPVTKAEQTTARTFQVNGRVRKVDLTEKTVTVAHNEIPGYMPAMTMPLTVKNVVLLAGLQAGDEIHFELSVTEDDSWISSLEKIGNPTASVPQSIALVEENAGLHSGELVPDFALTDQNGKPVRLQDFRGKSVVLTFIYTRCPLPNFCPLMSKNFKDLQERLTKAYPGKFQLLSVSIDPKFDTSEVLKGYAQIYHADETSWSFATGTKEQIDSLTSTFGLVHEQESGLISHNLRTALIGTGGRLIHLWKSNAWTPYEVQRRLDETMVPQFSAK